MSVAGYVLSCAFVAVAFGPIEPSELKTDAFLDELWISRRTAPELRFGCAVVVDLTEEKYAKQMINPKAAIEDRFIAARALWRGRSRYYAVDVLKFMAGDLPGYNPFSSFKQEIASAVSPAAILRELQEGDYEWGAWLAFLRPHKDFVPVLLKARTAKPKMLPETLLALGNSRDQRALEPLLELLRSKDYLIAGAAAQALGYLGIPSAEPRLIEGLADDNPWRQINACGALQKIGTRRSLPALEKLAKDDRYTGALAVKRMAEDAIESINKRENSLECSNPNRRHRIEALHPSNAATKNWEN